MAAEIQPKPLTRKPILLQRVEGSQEVVNMAVIVPKEEGVISVSEDRYRPLPLCREEGRDGLAILEPASGAVLPRRRKCRHAPLSFYYNTYPGGAGVGSCAAAAAWVGEADIRQRRTLWAPPEPVNACGRQGGPWTNATRATLVLGPALRTGGGEGGAARPCRCVPGEDAPSRLCENNRGFWSSLVQFLGLQTEKANATLLPDIPTESRFPGHLTLNSVNIAKL